MATIAIKRPRTAAVDDPTPPGSRVLQPGSVFRPDSFWSTSGGLLADDAPVHPSSATWISNLVWQMGLDPASPNGLSFNTRGADMAGKAWFNIGTGGVPVYIVDADQATVQVANRYELDEDAWPTIDQENAVFMQGIPIPDGAVVDASSDHTLVIYQPSTGTYWELYEAFFGDYTGTGPNALTWSGWSCRGGGRMQEVWNRVGTYQLRVDADGTVIEGTDWGHTATGLPIMGGIFTPEEWADPDPHAINHIMHFLVGDASTQFLAPAHRTDGAQNDTWIREGARVRFAPDVDLSYLTGRTDYAALSALKLAYAIRDYGMICTDTLANNTGAFAFRGRGGETYDVQPWSFVDADGTQHSGQYNTWIWLLPWSTAVVLDPSVSPE